MPSVFAQTSNPDDGYTANLTTGTYNNTLAVSARNSTTSTFTNTTLTYSFVMHGVIFGRAYNYRTWVSFPLSGNDSDGDSLSGNTVVSAQLKVMTLANVSGFVTQTADTNDEIYICKRSNFTDTNITANSNYNDLDGWVSSGTYNGNVTTYGNFTQAAGATITTDLNATAVSDINTQISAGGNLIIGLLTEDDFLESSELGTVSSQNLEGIRIETSETLLGNSAKPTLILTYGASGYSHEVMGVDSANIGKVTGVATANIGKVTGV